MSNRLSNTLLRQFQDALSSAFISHSELEQMVFYCLGEDLDAIAGGKNITENAFNLIRWAKSEGRLQELIDGALAEKPQNPELKAFEQAWRKANQPSLPADILVHDPATIEPLSDAKFKFLFFVYDSSKTNTHSNIVLSNIQDLCNLSEQRAASIATFLAQKGLVKFTTINAGISLLHKGVIVVESRVLRHTQLPDYIGEIHRVEIQKRVILRYEILRRLFEISEGGTSTRVRVTDLATEFNANSKGEMSQLLRFLDAEQWVKMPNTDQAMLTEKSLDYFELLSSEDDAFSDVI